MTYYQRRSIRLRDYDYAQSGAYYVTLCAYNHQHLFGQISDGMMTVNTWGKTIQDCWDEIPVHFPKVELDAFVIMPNHLHAVVLLFDDSTSHPVGATHGSPSKNGPQRGSIGAILGQFKSSATRRLKSLAQPANQPVWQRNYYEHIVRNEASLNEIRTYIALNPARWMDDDFYTALDDRSI